MRRQLSTDGKQEFRTGMDTYKEWQKKDGRRVRIDICHKMNLNNQDIVVVGNSQNDLEMIESFPYTIAVNEAEQCIRDKATITMDIEQMPMFI